MNYEAKARSNYFKVKDIQAFKDAIRKFSVFIELKDNAAPEKGLMIYPTEDNAGWPNWYLDEDTDDEMEIDFPAVVQEHIMEGEVAVLMSIGSEGYKYLTADGIIITSESVEYLSLNEMLMKRAKELNPNVTEPQY